MSKGSKRRPEDKDKIADNWDRIFGKKNLEEAYEQDGKTKQSKGSSREANEGEPKGNNV